MLLPKFTKTLTLSRQDYLYWVHLFISARQVSCYVYSTFLCNTQ